MDSLAAFTFAIAIRRLWTLTGPMQPILQTAGRGVFAALAMSSFGLVHAGEIEEQMAAAAHRFLGSLDADQRDAASFDWADPDRYDWHFIPKTRPGLALKDMRQDQQQLAFALLSVPMSQQGFLKSLTIMSLEDLLHEMENLNPIRDSRLYQFSLFGEPAEEGTWGFRVEGHHLSLNFTIVDGILASATPSFYGANPDKILSGPRAGEQILSAEQGIALELIETLSAEQNDVAQFDAESPADVLTGGNTQAEALEPVGISWDDLEEEQQDLLAELIGVYLFRNTDDWAEPEMDRVLDSGSVRFAWAGVPEQRQPHYYRIQAEDLVIEYANTQNGNNHSHATLRRVDNDFARDALRHHLEAEHGE